ncbi:MAG: hypothetical protein INF84_05545 [Roseomonas sp.]|nr:hypothetical protein [Roseomonas sp.]
MTWALPFVEVGFMPWDGGLADTRAAGEHPDRRLAMTQNSTTRFKPLACHDALSRFQELQHASAPAQNRKG